MMTNSLWLGYDGLTVPLVDIVAVLLYRTTLDRLITRSYGHVPGGVRSVVVTSSRGYLPARWHAEHVRRRWSYWRAHFQSNG